jgi:protein-S-isoprenylcysteine O-methyltransferase Ste14
MTLKEQFERTGNLFFCWRSYLPLLMAVLFIGALLDGYHPGGYSPVGKIWGLGCLAVSLGGLAIRFFTVGFVPAGTSGRNTRGQVADSLNTTGMYSVVRNPLYLGNFIIWFGLSLFTRSWWCTTLIVLFFIIFYERIIFAEERFLQEKFGDTFLTWAADTPAILPRFRNWRPPDLPFSWKAALNREYATFYSIIVSFTLLAVLSNLILAGNFAPARMWLLIFLTGTIIYLTVRFLKKKTKILSTMDR